MLFERRNRFDSIVSPVILVRRLRTEYSLRRDRSGEDWNPFVCALLDTVRDLTGLYMGRRLRSGKSSLRERQYLHPFLVFTRLASNVSSK
ncbi:hypothetical protein PMAYCL1PPCAC_29478, partial [Pristionchus mayeri]